jgi:hypothetical protein
MAYLRAGALANPAWAAHNYSMTVTGHIQNGVVVLDGGTTFPDGTPVFVFPLSPQPVLLMTPGELPVVLGGVPGSVHLTNERINEIFEEEDIAAMKGMWNVPFLIATPCSRSIP